MNAMISCIQSPKYITPPTPGYVLSNPPRSKRFRLAAAPHDNVIAVIGAGPGGLSAAIALRSIGVETIVLERAAELPSGGTALGLWTNAWRALEALGARERLQELHPISIRGVELCRQDGRLLRHFSVSECKLSSGMHHEFRGVRRASLVRALAEKLPLRAIQFNSEILGLKNEGSHIEIELAGGCGNVKCAAVIGADGVRSRVAAALGRAPAKYAGQVAIRGVAHFPQGVPCQTIRQVWGVGPRAGMYSISATELYWFVCFDAPASELMPTEASRIKERALNVVQGWNWGVEEAVRCTSPEECRWSFLSDRWEAPFLLQKNPFHGRATLVGDALHPMTPNLGQGGCTALEDGVVLARCVGAVPGARALEREALGQAFMKYERQRAMRCLPLAVRSRLMGAALQLPFSPVVAVRDLFVSTLFDASHFLDHAEFDCGSLSDLGVEHVTAK